MKRLIIGAGAFLLTGLVLAATPLLDYINERGVVSYNLHEDASRALASRKDFEEVTVANTITFDECGTTYILNSATEFASTLPAPEMGCSFRFIVKAAPVGAAYTVVTSGGSNLIDGSLTVDGAAVPCVDEDTVTFTASAAVSGDQIEVYSDGTSWFVQGVGEAATALACSAT